MLARRVEEHETGSGRDSSRPPRPERTGASVVPILGAIIGVAWIVAIWAEMSGAAVQVHHHALYESGRPFWLAALILIAAWQVMTAAMMLPSSLAFMKMYAAAAAAAPGFGRALAALLLGYFGIWSLFALAAFAGDMQLHRLVDSWPWLAAHAQVIPAGTLAFAAIYQFTPLKDACLKACRNPGAYLIRHYKRGTLDGLRIGLGHAAFCVGCCWALMLVMFAAGVAHLAWMGVLGVIMLVEKGVRGGDRIVAPVGLALAALAAIALVAPGAVPGI
jgi:predicted metal-binding membrane protein